MRNLAIACLFVLQSLASYDAHAQRGQTEGINDNYKAQDLNAKEWVKRFEGESREVFVHRRDIVAALDVKTGASIADVGAGTGLFVPFLAQRVGGQGKVYAVDIAPAFIEHIRKKAKDENLTQVVAVLSTERSIELPANSVDLIFMSDAYHHFVHYKEMLASMHKALKPGGQLIVIDFDIEAKGVEAWLVEHVGEKKSVFRKQIEAAGFTFAKDMTLPAMKTSFIYRFTK